MSTKFYDYSIVASWGARGETPDALADRTRRLIVQLQAIDPALAHWYHWPSDRRVVALDLSPQSLASKIADGVCRDEDGTSFQPAGYDFRFYNHNRTHGDSRSFALKVRAGDGIYHNSIVLDTVSRIPPDPAVITYPIFKAALLAICECFEATYCDAFSNDLADLWPDRGRHMPALRLAWISYVSPRFAPLVTPPASAITEYQPNGGLLMAATDETFQAANPQHLAVAQDILAAVAPLNANPWPDEKPH